MLCRNEIVEVGGLHVSHWGSAGPAIVFLHYFAGSCFDWAMVASALAAECRCIAPDLRGFGHSTAPPSRAFAHRVEDYADDVEIIASAFGLERFVLVGHSMGGKIAMTYAARAPQALAALVLVAPSPPTPEPMPEATRADMLVTYGSRDAARKTVQRITAKCLTRAVTRRLESDMLRCTRRAWDAWLLEGSRENIAERMHSIRVPTHLIAGERDPVMQLDMLQREVRDRIQGTTMSIASGAGHLVPIEAPESVIGAVRLAVLPRPAGDAAVRERTPSSSA